MNPFLLIALLVFFASRNSITGIGAIVKTKFTAPYTSDGKTTFNDAVGKSGVYIIKEHGTIVYVGYSGKNLYRTLYRHFQQWNHKYQQVTTYAGNNRNNYTVRIIYTTPHQAERLEAYLVNKYQPRDNDIKLKKYAESNVGKEEYKKYREADLEPLPF